MYLGRDAFEISSFKSYSQVGNYMPYKSEKYSSAQLWTHGIAVGASLLLEDPMSKLWTCY